MQGKSTNHHSGVFIYDGNPPIFFVEVDFSTPNAEEWLDYEKRRSGSPRKLAVIIPLKKLWCFKVGFSLYHQNKVVIFNPISTDGDVEV